MVLNMPWFLVLMAFFVTGMGLSTAQGDDQEEFFESKIRPILAKHCFECHGEKKQESSIRLDHKSMVMGKTTETALVTPGKADESRLWQVIKYDDNDIQMPPSAPLPVEEQNLLKVWIERGAYWPEEANPAPALKRGIPHQSDGSIDFVAAVSQHWAYQPLHEVPVPRPSSTTGIRTDMDCFLKVALEQAGLTFSPQASRETLIRRLKMDLHGIPPSYGEVQEFVHNESPAAIEQLVDQLLASPLYGQRWGRHWLDIARYADTKGYVFTDNRFYPFSFTYRDYVVNAFNHDTPYNEFIREQLAADQLGLPEADPRLAALGFLTVGPRFLNREPDIIDDRIDVVTRGLMGMTVACARCHDHKYDPIPTADYYSLYGVFQSSYEPDQGPLVEPINPNDPGTKAFQEERAKREKAITDFVHEKHTELLKLSVDRLEDLIPAAAQSMKLIGEKADLQLKHGNPRVKLVDLWKKFLERQLKAHDPVFLAWERLMAIPDDKLASSGTEALQALLANPAVPGPLKTAIQSAPPKSHLDVARVYAQVFTQAAKEWEAAQKEQPPRTALADAQLDLFRKALYGPQSLTDVPEVERSPLFERDQFDRLRKLHAAVTAWDATSPDAPPRSMVMFDKEKPVNPVIFVRGNPARRGDVVTRHSPRILDPEKERPFAHGSGRKELAERIVAEDNPLTARVIVNRVWQQHFGTGLVSTASDFGSRSDPPTHPELLDYLAWTFIHHDHWSLKSLHRRILLSQAYLQESVDRPDARKIDPENRLLWKQNRQRMDFEAMRDSMLQAAGLLDVQLGGRPFHIEKEANARRRTIYAQIDRNNLPGLLRTFDFPSPDTSSPGRPLTTVPQQALFSLNSPFSMQTGTQLAEQVRRQAKSEPEQVQLLVERVLGRSLQQGEVSLMENYLHEHSLEELAQALLMTNEFLFVD